jgi:Ca2+-binding EF-hand superfamily protein
MEAVCQLAASEEGAPETISDQAFGKAQIREIFDELDEDQSGFLSRQEFRAVIAKHSASCLREQCLNQ